MAPAGVLAKLGLTAKGATAGSKGSSWGGSVAGSVKGGSEGGSAKSGGKGGSGGKAAAPTQSVNALGAHPAAAKGHQTAKDHQRQQKSYDF